MCKAYNSHSNPNPHTLFILTTYSDIWTSPSIIAAALCSLHKGMIHCGDVARWTLAMLQPKCLTYSYPKPQGTDNSLPPHLQRFCLLKENQSHCLCDITSK